tara:strand:+ start:1002 stop:1499 length:498 start_codon:yes stop_codon:yes gene_type:complete
LSPLGLLDHNLLKLGDNMNTIATYSPGRRVPGLLGSRVFDNLFESFFSDFPHHLQRSTHGYPVADIYQNDDGSTCLELALAGFTKDDLSVAIQPEKRSITVSANMSNDDDTQSNRRIARRSFQKTYVNYDDNLDIAKAEANFENGLLTVSVPTRAEVQPVEIKIL